MTTVLSNYLLVLAAGLVAAFSTGLGTVPLFWFRDIETRVDVTLWGVAGGLMASALIFGLLYEAYLDHSSLLFVGGGFVVGILFVLGAHEIVERFDYQPTDIAEADFRTITNILVVLFVHSFPEGLAIGVSFAALNFGDGIHWLGFTIPTLAIVMTTALAIHNIPEGIAVGIPLSKQSSVSNARMWWAAVLTSVPQPIGALIAFYFVRLAQQFLGFGYGVAAGAMIYLVIDDILPEGLEVGESLPQRGVPYLAGGTLLGFVAMMPLLFLL